jgi:hypothetical protein
MLALFQCVTDLLISSVCCDRPPQLDSAYLTSSSMSRCAIAEDKGLWSSNRLMVHARAHNYLHGDLMPCAAVCFPQTVATNVDVFALAGAQDTAVAVQIPAFNVATFSDFTISFPHAVWFLTLRVHTYLHLETLHEWQALGLHGLLPCVSHPTPPSQVPPN